MYITLVDSIRYIALLCTELHLLLLYRPSPCKAPSGSGAMSGLPPETYAGASSCHHQCEGGTPEPCVRSCTAVTDRSHPSSWRLRTEASALVGNRDRDRVR